MNNARIESYGSGRVTIAGLSQNEVDKVVGVAGGFSWLRIHEGIVQTIPAFSKLPDPVQDETMLPFWKEGPVKSIQHELIDLIFEDLDSRALYSPHIIITGLCGYHYTKELYQREAERLKACGFEQMRSHRHDNGKYHEIWYLPGIWAAKGELAQAIHGTEEPKHEGKVTPSMHEKEKRELRAAIEFLRHHVMFGSLDVSVQRCAMVIDTE